MEPVLQIPIDGTHRPNLFFFGSVSAGQPYSSPGPFPAGRVMLVLGVDVYPNIQPNNGSFQCEAHDNDSYGPQVTLYVVQQSQNFPGPFHWRGLYPIFANASYFSAEGTVPFTFLVWGITVPDWTLD